jgi:hypothetical protein
VKLWIAELAQRKPWSKYDQDCVFTREQLAREDTYEILEMPESANGDTPLRNEVVTSNPQPDEDREPEDQDGEVQDYESDEEDDLIEAIDPVRLPCFIMNLNNLLLG